MTRRRGGAEEDAERPVDVCVLGGGPAGATIALRLAQLGHSVVVVEKAAFPRPHVGESLTPDILAILDVLRVREAVEREGFLRPEAALVRWGAETTVRASGVPGFQVDRPRFDLLLLRAAAAAGATVLQPCTEVETIQARYLVDATGRRGRLGGRKRRVSLPLFALYAYWKDTGVNGPETRVEAGESEWYWGAPLPDGSFNATVFLDTARCGEDREALYERLLQRSALLKTCLAGRRLGPVACCDASSWCDEEPVTESVLKIGEASYSIDPLSSQGVRSAMGSALHGPIVLNTILRRPESGEIARTFYRARQQEAVDLHRLWTGRHYAVPARVYETPFWRHRALEEVPPAPAAPDVTPLDSDSWLAVAPQTRIVGMPRVEGDFVVEGRAIEHPNLARPLSFLGGCDIPDLLDGMTAPVRLTDLPPQTREIFVELHRLGVVTSRPQSAPCPK